MTRFLINRELACRTCGYDLRGISALSKCPECGSDAMQSVVSASDPELVEFTRLRSPRRIAIALVTMTSCMALAVAGQMVGPGIAVIEQLLERPTPAPARALAVGWVGAALLLLVGAVAAARIAPVSEPLLRAEWGRRRTAAWLGLALWAAAIAGLPPAFGWRGPPFAPDPFVLIVTTAWQLLTAMAPLGALRMLLSLLGRRSRHWREARQGRQGVDALVGAAGALLVFSTAVPIMHAYRFETLHSISLLLAASSAAILVLGFVYIVMNSVWIARTLLHPPPPTHELVDDAAGAPGRH